MRLLVVGAGSTGGYFGGRLAQAGRDVTFLVRPRRAAQLQEGGLQIVSPHGDVTVRPKLVTADDIDAPYDAVLLAVKAYSLDAAIDDFATAVGPETTIMPVLNGMRHVDILEERFGKKAVAGGVCKVATTVDSGGRIVQLATFQELVYGEWDGAVSADGGTRRFHARRRVRCSAFPFDRVRDVGKMDAARHSGRDHLPDARKYRGGGGRAGRRIVHPELSR
jgi:2-dehydropantoate 2-reductase